MCTSHCNSDVPWPAEQVALAATGASSRIAALDSSVEGGSTPGHTAASRLGGCVTIPPVTIRAA